MTDLKISVEIPTITNSRKKFNQRLSDAIKGKLENIGAEPTPEDLNQILVMMNEGKNKTQVSEDLIKMFGDNIKSSFVDWLFGYANAYSVSSPELEEEAVSPTNKSEKSSIKDKTEKKAENKSKTKRRISQSSRSRRNSKSIAGSINEKIQTPVSPPPSPPKSKASSVYSDDKSQKNIYHQRRLSRSANTLDITSQVQTEIMAQTLALAAAIDMKMKNEKDVKSERRRSIRSVKSHKSYSSSVEEDTSKIKCSYWPTCNRGDQCKFWHPKELCKRFPHCPDGDNCLFIHPAQSSNPPSKPQSLPYNRKQEAPSPVTSTQERIAVECKYGASCNRLDCKYSHPSPAIAAKIAKRNSISNGSALNQQPQQQPPQQQHFTQDNKGGKSNVPCHYYPNCKNADCPYMHPVATKPNSEVNVACRYGSSCNRQDCHFLHPSTRRL